MEVSSGSTGQSTSPAALRMAQLQQGKAGWDVGRSGDAVLLLEAEAWLPMLPSDASQVEDLALTPAGRPGPRHSQTLASDLPGCCRRRGRRQWRRPDYDVWNVGRAVQLPHQRHTEPQEGAGLGLGARLDASNSRLAAPPPNTPPPFPIPVPFPIAGRCSGDLSTASILSPEDLCRYSAPMPLPAPVDVPTC